MASKGRVVVGMSGGVDSSVAAALMLQQGYEVIGITLKLWPQDCASLVEDKCCGPQAMEDARTVAARLGIPHYVIDETGDFTKHVIDYFTTEYQSGRTPNPCVMCNERLKFGNLLQKARGLGATHVVTGHYVRIESTPRGYVLKKSLDPRKDQSYFLFSLSQDQLSQMMTPIGGMTKQEVRDAAKAAGMRVHDKDESQDICFVPENDYASFVKSHLCLTEFQPGDIVHRDGRVLGKHQGIELFTVGQRKGINVGSPKPLYVMKIDPEKRQVIVGDDGDLWHSALLADRIVWGIQGALPDGTELTVKVRHSHTGSPARIYSNENGGLRIEFSEPQRAITPGQATVFYEGDTLVGGGWIQKALVEDSHSMDGRKSREVA